MIRIFHVGHEHSDVGTPGCRTEALLTQLYKEAIDKGLNPKNVVTAFWRRKDPAAPIVLDWSGSPFVFVSKMTKFRYKPILWTQIDGQSTQGDAIRTHREVWVVDPDPDATLAQAKREKNAWMLDVLERMKAGTNWLVVPDGAWRWWQRGRAKAVWDPFLKSYDMMEASTDRDLDVKRAEIEKLDAEIIERRDQAERIRRGEGESAAEVRKAKLENEVLREKLALLEAQLSPKKPKSATV
jgi:hypothetical protein